MTWLLCMGDSLTASVYPYYLRCLLQQEQQPPRVITLAKKGYGSRRYLRYTLSHLPLWQTVFSGTVLLMLGTNDVRRGFNYNTTKGFYRHMDKLVGHILAAGFTLIISLVPPVQAAAWPEFSSRSRRRIVSEINPAIRSLAKQHHLPLVDNYTPLQHTAFPDGVHPDDQGCRLIAQNWHQRLKGRP